MTKLLILFLLCACSAPFNYDRNNNERGEDLNVEQPQSNTPEITPNEEESVAEEPEATPENKTQPGGASGVGNAFWDAEIVKLELSGDYVGIDNDTLFNYDNDGKKLGPVKTFIKDNETTVELAESPKRHQEIINIDAELFALVRSLATPQTQYEDVLPPDAFLVRKSDGNVWKISDRVVNKDSFDIVTKGETKRIFFTSANNRSCYSFCKWFHSSRGGDILAYLDITQGSNDVKKTIVYEQGISDYGRLGYNNVAIESSGKDLWINGIDQNRPIPQLMSTINKYFSRFDFLNGYAFLMSDSSPFNLLVYKESLNDPTIIPVAAPNRLGGHIYWSMLVGDKFVIGNSRYSIVLNRQLELLNFRENTIAMNWGSQLQQFKKYSVASNAGYLCLLQVSSTDEVPRACAELNTLKIRGTIKSHDESTDGDIIVYSEVEGTQDIEKVTLTLENEAIKVLARESVSSYAPSRLNLIPISNAYENIPGLF